MQLKHHGNRGEMGASQASYQGPDRAQCFPTFRSLADSSAVYFTHLVSATFDVNCRSVVEFLKLRLMFASRSRLCLRDAQRTASRSHLMTPSVSVSLPKRREDDIPFAEQSETSLVTVIATPQKGGSSAITTSCLQDVIDDYRPDDVFCSEFLQGVAFLAGVDHDVGLAPSVQDLLTELGVEWSCFLKAAKPGPFTKLRVKTASDGYLDVAVPSRLRYATNDDLPIQGLRVAVKDNMRLKGLKTSLCNRAYCQTYPAQSATAALIQTLIDSGAIVLGKTKLGSFGHWEKPMEYIDYLAPWNPRGDGY
nr:putative amidase [Quercus suber]